MMKSSLHTLFNTIHQISGYAGLLRKHPDRVDEYAEIIEKNSRLLERMVQDLFQIDHGNPDAPSIRLNTDIIAGKKVLIVDDMSENREILRDIFLTLKCNVETVSNGLEALSVAEAFAPDIVCIDIVMPGMDGHQTAEGLRKLASSATLIAISAIQEAGVKHTFDGWLSKPFTADQIITLLTSQILRKQKSERSTVDLSVLDGEFRRKLMEALDKGALSRSEMLVNTLANSASKQWLSDRLSEMDFKTVQNAIVSASSEAKKQLISKEV